MSIRACDQVWRRAKAKGSARLLLLAIADCANDEGTHAYPSIATLAEKTKLTQRQIINIVQALEASGELSVVRPKVRRTGLANVYTLHVGDLNPIGAKIAREKTSSEISAAMGEAGYSTTVHIEPSEDDSTGVEAQTLWHATLDQLGEQYNISTGNLGLLRSLPARLERGVLVVRAPADIARMWAGIVGRVVRFES